MTARTIAHTHSRVFPGAAVQLEDIAVEGEKLLHMVSHPFSFILNDGIVSVLFIK